MDVTYGGHIRMSHREDVCHILMSHREDVCHILMSHSEVVETLMRLFSCGLRHPERRFSIHFLRSLEAMAVRAIILQHKKE
jgi:hypothetical protein